MYYHLAFYDHNGCYDETFIEPTTMKEIGYALFSLVQYDGNQGEDYVRLFIEYDDGSESEITVTKG